MAITYTQLVAAIKEYTENDETTFVANIDRFIQQAEDRILHTVQLTEFRRNSTGAMTASNQYLAAPSDYISNYSLAYVDASGDHQFLIHKDVNFIREAYPSASTTGGPRFYAEFDAETFILAPTPSAAFVTEIHYFYRPTSIVTTATTTWLGDNMEEVLLYGCLVEAYTYMKGEEDIIKLYSDRYNEALGRLKVLGEGKQRKDTYREQQIKQPVT